MNNLYIDLGATNVFIGISKNKFDDIIKISTKKFFNNSSKIIDKIKNDNDIEKTAVALPGPINREKNEIYPPNIPEEKINIRDLFKELGNDIIFINDCHAGVIGEYVYGEKQSENMIYLTISTGIGAGVLSNGNLLKGWKGNFAEVGHMIIEGDRRCGCGGKGHWEAYCSGRNVVEYAEEMYDKIYDDAKQLFEAFKNGDKEASKAVNKFQEINAKAISNLINLYNPKLIVIGGSLAINNPKLIIGKNDKIIEKNSINTVPKIKVTSLGNNSVLHGLRAICLNKFDYTH